ncbi:MAG TPA: hypothetical protein VJ972_11550, partial [Anaerolineales bacterium]|nr:hypothetical protein [Anaerolineales bacterium]
PDQAENLLPEKPTLLVFQPLEKEILERVGSSFVREAIIKVLIVCLRFEPELIRIREEQSTKEQEYEDEAKRGLGH